MFDLDRAVLAWRRDYARERSFTTSDLDELEDHVRVAYEVELELNPALPPARAFAHACETLGTARALSGEFAKVEGRWWRRLLHFSWATWGISFFLPVARNGITLAHPSLHDGGLPGINAILMSGYAGGVLGVLSALTNLLMLFTFFHVGDAGRRRVRTLALLLMGAVLINLTWLVRTQPLSDLYAGYYVWLESFGLAATALAMRAVGGSFPHGERSVLISK